MKTHNITLSVVTLASAAVLTLAAAPQARAAQANSSVFQVMSADPRFTTTMQMVYVAGAARRLQQAGELTVFAATDKGWADSSDTGKLSALTSTGATSEFPDSMGILEIVRGFFVHAPPPPSTATDVKMESNAGKQIDFDPKTLEVKWTDADGDVKTAHVDGQPIVATNGVVYPVDAVVGE